MVDEGDGAGDESRSSRPAPRTVPGPWLGNNEGEYAASLNWSGDTEVDGLFGDDVEDGICENGKTFS